VDLDVVFLGTGGAMPSALRGSPALLVRRGGERLLVDCGEGTQRQLLRSAVGLVDIDVLLLTHYHGDHVYGLPGLLKTFALRGRDVPLAVFGPPGLASVFRAFSPLTGRLPYPLELREVEAGETIDRAGYLLEAHRVLHRGPSVAWSLAEPVRPGRFDVEAARELGVPEGPLFGRLQRGDAVATPHGREVRPEDVLGPARPGRRIVLSGDTRPCDGVLAASVRANLLVHEATFTAGDAERARDTGHSTAAEAATLGAEAGVTLLALVHLSQRVRPHEVKEEARAVFSATVVPRDFDTVAVPYPEQGPPALRRGGALGPAERRDLGLGDEAALAVADTEVEQA
jgi:ribonuclease Z